MNGRSSRIRIIDFFITFIVMSFRLMKSNVIFNTKNEDNPYKALPFLLKINYLFRFIALNFEGVWPVNFLNELVNDVLLLKPD